MRNESQTTLIGLIRRRFNAWKRRNAWSNETTFQHVVHAHAQLNGAALTGISFEPETQDTFTRMRINAERICRWLDDESKTNNLLPANFIPSLLLSLPMEDRAALVEEILRPLGLGVRQLGGTAPQFDVLSTLREVTRETGEAQQALINLADGATQDELHTAARELRELSDAVNKAQKAVEAQQGGDVIKLTDFARGA